MAALANENTEVREVEVGLILATSIFALSFASLWSIVELDFAASYSNVLVSRFARSQDGFAGGCAKIYLATFTDASILSS